MKTAVLVVSFGAVSSEARKNSLDKIENDIAKAFPDYYIYRAYTSGIVIRRIYENENIHIDTLKEAFEKMRTNGITDVIVQPTHMIDGIEYKKICRICDEHKDVFSSLKVGKALLEKYEDCIKTVDIISKEIDFNSSYEYILMGHGSEDTANIRYEQMNVAFVNQGLTNVRIATVEAKPDIDEAIERLGNKENVKKVIIQPFMMVAGDHAKNDMAGEKNSFYSKVKDAGYDAKCVIMGLGEYKLIRNMIVENLEGMIN
ncbi:Sirohydrochlorin cobaltochelatase [bioreactor metagenome]|uniref:Sirohydrochlorin cobaltochelatase n=1 Tax=bioreactor metagenome TaxID=1076179 RepID=A0A645A380_9ZZZZ|nr:sirohydrochlorin cobaltochelatase [Candidatus Metalachnospira sp.]